MLYGGGGAPPGDTIEAGAIALRFTDHPSGPGARRKSIYRQGAPDRPNSPLAPGGSLFHPDCEDTLAASCAKSDPVRPTHVLGSFCLKPPIETDVGYYYAPNIVEAYTATNPDGGPDVYWNLSGWNPYRVHFLRTRIFPESR